MKTETNCQHEWGLSLGCSTYWCKKCGALKTNDESILIPQESTIQKPCPSGMYHCPICKMKIEDAMEVYHHWANHTTEEKSGWLHNPS